MRQNRVCLVAGVLVLASAMSGAAQEAEFSFVTARGHFEKEAVCAKVDRGVCEVLGNLMLLSFERNLRQAIGRGAVALRYQPFEQCPYWEIKSYFDFEGVVDGEWDLENPHPDKIARLSGTLSGDSTAVVQLPDGKGGCNARALPSAITGRWEATIRGLVADGSISIEGGDGTTIVPFLLEVMDSFAPGYGWIDFNTGCPRELDCEHFHFGPKGDTGMSAADGGRG